MSRESIVVRETTDADGDMLFSICLATYSKNAIDKLQELFPTIKFVYVPEE